MYDNIFPLSAFIFDPRFLPMTMWEGIGEGDVEEKPENIYQCQDVPLLRSTVEY